MTAAADTSIVALMSAKRLTANIAVIAAPIGQLRIAIITSR